MLLCCRPMNTRPRRLLLCGLAAAACLGGGAGSARAQAEAAPPGSVPPPPSPPPPRPPPPRVRVVGDLRFSGLLGEAREVAAPLGWGFGLQLSASLLPVG